MDSLMRRGGGPSLKREKHKTVPQISSAGGLNGKGSELIENYCCLLFECIIVTDRPGLQTCPSAKKWFCIWWKDAAWTKGEFNFGADPFSLGAYKWTGCPFVTVVTVELVTEDSL